MKPYWGLAWLALSGPTLAQTATIKGDPRSVEVLTTTEIAQEFATTCVAGYPAMTDVAAAVDRSQISYDDISDEGTAHVRRDWESDYGWMGFLSKLPSRPDITPQCDFSGFTAEASSDEEVRLALVSVMGAGLTDQELILRRDGIVLVVNETCALLRHHKRDDDRHVTLIVQPAGEGACRL